MRPPLMLDQWENTTVGRSCVACLKKKNKKQMLRRPRLRTEEVHRLTSDPVAVNKRGGLCTCGMLFHWCVRVCDCRSVINHHVAAGEPWTQISYRICLRMLFFLLIIISARRTQSTLKETFQTAAAVSTSQCLYIWTSDNFLVLPPVYELVLWRPTWMFSLQPEADLLYLPVCLPNARKSPPASAQWRLHLRPHTLQAELQDAANRVVSFDLWYKSNAIFQVV